MLIIIIIIDSYKILTHIHTHYKNINLDIINIYNINSIELVYILYKYEHVYTKNIFQEVFSNKL